MTEEGRLIAVGDIHGCSKALSALIEAIQPTPLDTLVFLGDYIDRGPDSRGVIEQVIALGEHCTVVPLLGNHEEMMLAVLEGKSDAGFWSRNFGKETLDSYGGDLKNIPPEHVQFLKGCRNYYETVSHMFVHAYYEPHLRLHQQCWAGLRWASLPPNPKPHCSGKVVIVGHTAQTSGEILDLGFVKCIDTFCHGGGWLTALDVRSGRVWQADEKGLLRALAHL